MVKSDMKKKKLLIVGLLLLLVLSPRIYWSLKEAKPLDIAIIDKTVPQKDYREHNGLFQVLKSQKIVRPDGEMYDVGRDYYGYDPYEQVATKPFTNRSVDMIYVTDTYGVFSDDLEKKPDGEQSELIYGSMDLLEWNELMASKSQNTTLIAEFNSFASPTSEEVSKIMQHNLGLKWDGWIGRYFPDLASEEVPAWLIRNFSDQSSKKWSYKGDGIAYVHTSGEIVLLTGKDSKGPIHFALTEKGVKKFPSVSSSPYLYWFDVVEPTEGTEVLASYELNLSKAGYSKLEAANIPFEFPAVLYKESDLTYYFAGDYADFNKKPIVTFQGIHHIYKYLAKDVSSFYWLTYFPMMETILKETYERKSGE